MEKTFWGDSVTERITSRLEWIANSAGDSVGGALQLQLLQADEVLGEYHFTGNTIYFMRNVIGTLHGGSCAVVVDQAMGLVANCLFDDEPHAPTSQLQLNFHRPMMTEESFIVRVKVVSTSRSMIHLSAEVYAQKVPEKLCVSATSIFFRGNKE